MALSPAELDSLEEVNKVEAFCDTSGYHENQGFGFTHAAHDAIHAEDRTGRFKDAEKSKSPEEKGNKITCTRHFMQVMGGNTPLSAFQDYIKDNLNSTQIEFLKNIDPDLEQTVENSLNVEGAQETVVKLAEYATENGEPAAEELYEGSIKGHDGKTILTKADHIAYENSINSCTLQQSVEGNIDGTSLDYYADATPLASTAETTALTTTTPKADIVAPM